MYKKLLVAIDGSECAQHALDEAIAVATLTQGSIRLAYVVDEPAVLAAAGYYDPISLREAMLTQAKATLDGAREEVAANHVAVDTEIVHTLDVNRDVAECINMAAQGWGAELIVLGTHGRRGPSRLMLGSVAERVLRVADTPVLIVRVPRNASKSTIRPTPDVETVTDTPASR